VHADVMRVALTLSLVAIASSVSASRIVYRDVDLATALEHTTIVVEARYVGIEHHAHRFDVVRRLTATGPESGAIHVTTPEREAGHRVAQAYRATGVRRSPLLQRLGPRDALQAGRAYCVLLRGSGTDLRLAVSAAHGAAPCRAVEAALSRR